ncbi:MAG: glycosyltransferase family 9 protein [Planctomycetota bacterium]
MRRQLLVRRGALGDTVLVEPLARAMRAERPDLRLDMAGVEENVALMAALGACERAFSTEILAARIAGYDRVVADDPRVAAMHANACCYDAVILGDVRRPASRELLDRTGYAGFADGVPRLQRPAVVETSAALLHPGAGAPRKCRAAAFWSELASRLHDAGIDAAFAVGPVERERGFDLEALGSIAPVVQPSTPVALSEAIAARAVFVGHDSGPTHLAAALGTITFALFVASDPAVWAPPRARVSDASVDARTLCAAITSALRRRATDGCR